jgi:hypothetical protein
MIELRLTRLPRHPLREGLDKAWSDIIKVAIWACVLVIMIGLGGCAALIPGYAQGLAASETVVREGIEEYKQYQDRKMQAIFAAMCQPSVGAYFRLNAAQRQVVFNACGGRDTQVGGMGSATYMP